MRLSGDFFCKYGAPNRTLRGLSVLINTKDRSEISALVHFHRAPSLHGNPIKFQFQSRARRATMVEGTLGLWQDVCIGIELVCAALGVSLHAESVLV